MAYDKTIDMTYKFDAVDVNAGQTLKCAPPDGKTRGIIRTVIAYGTGTTVAGAASAYTVGNSVTPTRYVANTSLNTLASPDRFILAEASSDVVVDLANDEASVVTDVEVVVNSLATAGTADFVVVIGWF